MTKKKKQPFHWILLTIGSVFVLMFCNLHQIKPLPVITLSPVKYDLPIETRIISLENNRYGDYLAGLWARQNQDYERTTRSFSQALNDDTDNNDLKTTVYLLRIIRGEIDEALPLAKELSSLNRPELMTDYVLIADALRRGEYTEADTLYPKNPPMDRMVY